MSKALATARAASRYLAGARPMSSKATSVRVVAVMGHHPHPSSSAGARRRGALLSRDGFRVMANMNISTAVTKKYETMKLPEIADAPVSALEGIADKRETALNNLRVKTVRDLGEWKYYRIAKSLVALAKTESEKPRREGCKFNLNKALDKEYETKSLAEILKAPPSALQGITPASDEQLKNLLIKTVEDLGTCKWAIWAEAIVILSAYDSDKS